MTTTTRTPEAWLRYLRAIADNLATGEVSPNEQRGDARKMREGLDAIEAALAGA